MSKPNRVYYSAKADAIHGHVIYRNPAGETVKASVVNEPEGVFLWEDAVDLGEWSNEWKYVESNRPWGPPYKFSSARPMLNWTDANSDLWAKASREAE